MTKPDDCFKHHISEPSMLLPSSTSLLHIEERKLEMEFGKEMFEILCHNIRNLDIKELIREVENALNIEKKQWELCCRDKFELEELRRKLQISINFWGTPQNRTLPYTFGFKRSSPFFHPFKLPRSNVLPVGYPNRFQPKVIPDGKLSPSKSNGKYYKTVLCESWTKSGTCKYGWGCRYAHGEYELKAWVGPKPCTFKTRSNNDLSGYCPYGRQSRFEHNSKNMQSAKTSKQGIKGTTEA